MPTLISILFSSVPGPMLAMFFSLLNRPQHHPVDIMRTGSTIAELLTVLAMLGVGACLLLPRGGVDTAAGYGLDVVVGVVALGAIAVCVAADWSLKRIAAFLPMYFAITIMTTYLTLILLNPQVIRCAKTLLHW